MSDKGKASAKDDDDGDSNNNNSNGDAATTTTTAAAATTTTTSAAAATTTRQQREQEEQLQQQQQQQQQQQLEAILNLMQSRAAGKATNEQLERAVQRMLGPSLPPSAAATARGSATASSSQSQQQVTGRRNVQADTDDYDDDDDEEKEEDENLKRETAKTRKGDATVQGTKTTPPSRNDKNSTNDDDEDNNNNNKKEIDWAAIYGDIPLGQQGARMMLTFGDGSPPPLAETVQATLRGARRMTQVAIQDARHVRRQRKKAFHEAQAVLKAETQRLKKTKRPKTTKSQSGATNNKKNKNDNEDSKTTTTTTTPITTPYQPISQWSPDLLYRVHTGYDSLAYNPPCGFDFEDLEYLFPEEMNAYKRWNKSYHAYADKAQASEEKPVDDQDQDEQESNTNNSNNNDDDEDDDVDDDLKSEGRENEEQGVGGHLQARAAQFDIRTDQMKKGKYIEFAELRKGSFLPRRMTVVEEEQITMDTKTTGWGSLPPIAVRFLHWLGFHPGSALPPPNLITTQALAFLAYDFFGRIVEKAIELRQAKKHHHKNKSSDDVDDDKILLELQPGERLQVNDIEQAMQHPEIRPVPLYRSGDDGKGTTSGTQLYFGPGFEYRLEMELEEIITASSRDGRKKKKRDQDDEERTKQKEDEELFERLAKD